MAKKITLAELSIDDKALIKSTQEIAKQLKVLKEDQTVLKKAGLEASKVYIQNASDIKILTGAYNENVKALSKRTQETAEAEIRQEKLTLALEAEATTIEGLRNQNKLLNQLRNTANLETAEGVKELTLLNAKLDENNAKIKENVDAYTKQKIEIGGYKDAIKEAFGELNLANGGLTGFIQRSQEAGGVTNLLTNSFKGMAKGIIGMTRASIAFLATPVGAVLGVIAGAVGLVINAFKRSEESTNKLKKAFAPLTGLFNKLLDVLEPVGEFLIDGIVYAFELTEKAILNTIGIIANALRSLGLDSAANKLTGFAQAIEETANASRRLADEEAKLIKNQREVERTQLNYQKNAERLRQLRDDESSSIADRIKANEELGAMLQEQGRAELELANQALLVTELRIQQEGEITELLDQKAERLLKIAEIEERILSQQSEQLTNNVSLRKEGEEKRKEIADKRIQGMEEELELLREQRRFEVQDLKEFQLLAVEEQKILDQKLKDRLISQTEYNTETLKLKNDLIEKEKGFNDAEYERLLEFEQKKQDLVNELRLRKEEDDEQREIIKAEIQFEKDTAEIEKLITDETQKTELLSLLEEERGLVLQEIRDKFNKIKEDALIETFKKEGELAEKNAQAQINIARQVAGILIGVLGDSLGVRLAGLAVDAAIQTGILTAASASAQARNYAQAVASAPPPLNIGNIALAVGQNATIEANTQAQKARIISSAALQGISSIAQKIKFREGGIVPISGPSHSGGGVPIFAGNQYVGEAEGDEGIGILSRPAFSSFMEYNNRFGEGKSYVGKYAGGGIITRQISPEGSMKEMQGLFSEVLETLSRPVVTVEDINREFNNKAVVENGANS